MPVRNTPKSKAGAATPPARKPDAPAKAPKSSGNVVAPDPAKAPGWRPTPELSALADAFERPEAAAARTELLARLSPGLDLTRAPPGQALQPAGALSVAGDAADVAGQLAQVEAQIAELSRKRTELGASIDKDLAATDQAIAEAEKSRQAVVDRWLDLKHGFFSIMHRAEIESLGHQVDRARDQVQLMQVRRTTMQGQVAMVRSEADALQGMQGVLDRAAQQLSGQGQPAGSRPELVQQQVAMLADALRGALAGAAPDLAADLRPLSQEAAALQAGLAQGLGTAEAEQRLAALEASLGSLKAKAGQAFAEADKVRDAETRLYYSKTPTEWDEIERQKLAGTGHQGRPTLEVDQKARVEHFTRLAVAAKASLDAVGVLAGLAERDAAARSAAGARPAGLFELRTQALRNVREQVVLLVQGLDAAHSGAADIQQLRAELGTLLASIDKRIGELQAFDRLAGAVLVQVSSALFMGAGLGPVGPWLAKGLSFAQTLAEHGLVAAFEQAVGAYAAQALSAGVVDLTGSKELAAALTAVGRGVVTDLSAQKALEGAVVAAALAGLSEAQRAVVQGLLDQPSGSTAKLDAVLDRPKASLDELKAAVAALG